MIRGAQYVNDRCAHVENVTGNRKKEFSFCDTNGKKHHVGDGNVGVHDPFSAATESVVIEACDDAPAHRTRATAASLRGSQERVCECGRAVGRKTRVEHDSRTKYEHHDRSGLSDYGGWRAAGGHGLNRSAAKRARGPRHSTPRRRRPFLGVTTSIRRARVTIGDDYGRGDGFRFGQDDDDDDDVG